MEDKEMLKKIRSSLLKSLEGLTDTETISKILYCVREVDAVLTEYRQLSE